MHNICTSSRVLVIVICVVCQGIAESKTGVGDEDVRNTAVNLVMVSQGPTLFKLNISNNIRLFDVNISFSVVKFNSN